MNQGISILCCYNDDEEVQRMLLSSLKDVINDGLPFDVDIHLIDTKAKGYKSAAEAYNQEVKLHQVDLKDILIFCHQDISFPDSQLLLTIDQELTLDSSQILGVAGMPMFGTPVSNLRYKYDGSFITRCQITDKTAVVSLDECLIALRKDVFMSMWFDEKNLKHWHLYAVDLCYNASFNHGISSFVIPQSVFHKYTADRGQQTDNIFLKELNALACKYRNHVDVIRTPCYILPTRAVVRYKQLLRTYMKHLLKR